MVDMGEMKNVNRHESRNHVQGYFYSDKMEKKITNLSIYTQSVME